ncbi:DNA ligase [Labeo rohita]|uniref:DNA ligase n=1 Tax=Labeo rohita TaxID=84645 RepID=A0ABQ8LMG2_LABRO|nr:DNA ligase [Labeo rohita]
MHFHPFSHSAVSSSEKVDLESVKEAPHSPQYKELLEVVTRAVAKLNINWPTEKQVELQQSKLDKRFLHNRPPPSHRSLPFFPDLQTEVSSGIVSKNSGLTLQASAYNICACLHTMAALQVYQADLDAVVSGEPIHQSLPPLNTAELGRLPPLRGSLEQLVWLVPAGVPFQDTKLAVQRNPEAGLERLVPLVDYLAAWKLLPNVSAWVLRTVETCGNIGHLVRKKCLHNTIDMSKTLTREERIEIVLISGERSNRVIAADFNARHPTRPPISHATIWVILVEMLQ